MKMTTDAKRSKSDMDGAEMIPLLFKTFTFICIEHKWEIIEMFWIHKGRCRYSWHAIYQFMHEGDSNMLYFSSAMMWEQQILVRRSSCCLKYVSWNTKCLLFKGTMREHENVLLVITSSTFKDSLRLTIVQNQVFYSLWSISNYWSVHIIDFITVNCTLCQLAASIKML